MKKVIIALDAMGGDNAPTIVIDGAALAIKENPNIFFNIFGDASIIENLINQHPILKENSNLIHTKEAVKGEDKLSEVIRNKETSMYLATLSVKNKESDAVVSAGNTGVFMALGALILKKLPGIQRPAIVTAVPTKKKPCVMLDLGANSENNRDHLLQFSIMGTIFSKVVIDIENPRVGLLNIGSEAMKGNELVQSAAELISQYKAINYQGFAEGTDIFSGNFDVIVTDGFTGNVTLKTIEGTAYFMGSLIKYLAKSAFIGKLFLGLFYLCVRKEIKEVTKVIDTRNYNGAMLIGLKGISVKSHGNADKVAYKHAINVAYKLAFKEVNKTLEQQISSTTED